MIWGRKLRVEDLPSQPTMIFFPMTKEVLKVRELKELGLLSKVSTCATAGQDIRDDDVRKPRGRTKDTFRVLRDLDSTVRNIHCV